MKSVCAIPQAFALFFTEGGELWKSAGLWMSDKGVIGKMFKYEGL